jgi:hypothetical protein
MYPNLVDGMLFWGISALGYKMMSRAFGPGMSWVLIAADIIISDISLQFRHVVLPYRLTRLLVMFFIGLAGNITQVEAVLCVMYAIILLTRTYLQMNAMLSSDIDTLFLVLVVMMYVAEAFEIFVHGRYLYSALNEYNAIYM